MDIARRKESLGALLKIDEKLARKKEIETLMSRTDFWQDHEKAGVVSQELSQIDGLLQIFENASTEEDMSKLEKELYFAGKFDDDSCFMSIYAGSGGTEAMDWAGMLLRMYLRYCEKNNLTAVVLDKAEGEEAGIKNATIEVKGFRAYGLLKSEHGTHRLVRISPFDADKARHTSFAGVEVVPEIEKSDFVIKPDDLKIDVYRSGGHGGQGVNTTDSAVRITHLPSKIVVTCQNERSQLQNKANAMKVLQGKLEILELEKQKQESSDAKGEVKQASWGNQIRSYVFMPYQLVKDLRTNYETSQVQAVMDGELGGFIESYLKYSVENRKE